MPRKLLPGQQMNKWNMYVDDLTKAEFMKALIDNGHRRAQGAAIRAFMKLYCSDKELQLRMKDLIEEEKILTPGGKESIL